MQGKSDSSPEEETCNYHENFPSSQHLSPQDLLCGWVPTKSMGLRCTVMHSFACYPKVTLGGGKHHTCYILTYVLAFKLFSLGVKP